ncbi:4-amino-4-deoxy-L-arabinose transferase-like glycosyltransferase [Pedobacter sp. W3I1]|uniref:ArnT family glycosyltransferase n=1 Tax=Pedobacter sp. W3I1 TaxID=3042291 RepID=UPI00277E4F5D|nr:glycosyltransferase family 39 protein [Pedobacter sp. W3I1]MDQ0641363.1 4-amino-4-deoxy-L-arabinose transferase-like glycosyltransferase [Pedobacter sp. W3I1]
MKLKDTTLYKSLIVLLAIASIPALFGGVMEPDGALYASMSKNIILFKDWFNLYGRGADWLDKPHLTFWISAASFKIFGISSFAYKLPSFLFGLLGAWYLYKLAKDIYDEKTGLISAVIFLSALHIITSTFDVRAEIYLTTFTLASIYHYYKAHQNSFWHIVAGSFFAACAILIKGIFVLIPVFAGFIIYWLLTKQYQQLLKPKWYIAILLIFVFITPELYSLYTQFDLHPEKIVFERTGVSGLKFFFWDSQFGRFFNNGPIKGKGDISFFLHTTLWAFLPWSVLFYTAVVNLFQKKNRIALAPESMMIWASAAVTFLIFSLSKFQLPHYILIIFPQFSIITALYLKKLGSKGLKTFFFIQNIIFILVIALLSILTFFFGFENPYLIIGILIVVFAISFLLFKGILLETIIARSAFLSIGLMVFLFVFFYPSLLKYQSGMQAGNWLKQNYPAAKPAVLNYIDAFSFDFYAPGEVKYLHNYNDLDKSKHLKDLVIYISEQELPKLKSEYNAEILKSFEYFHTTKLTGKFLNVKTRPQVLEHFYLVKIH